MKHWTPFLFLSLFWALALAAYSNSEMLALTKSLGKGYITLSDATYKKHLFGHRDYDVILFMTSRSPQLNCALCQEFAPALEAVAHLFASSYPNGVKSGKNLFFLYSDFIENRKLFELMGLDLIPKMYYLPATPENTGADSFNSQSEQYPFYQGDFVQLTKQWVVKMNGHEFQILVPTDYAKMVFNGLATFSIILLFKRFRGHIFALFLSNLIWGAATILLVLLFISGQMFNQIRSVPFINERGDKPEIISPNAQMQFGVETQIVSTLYGLLGVAFIILVNRVSSIKNAKIQFFAAMIVSALLYLLYSVFLSVFNIKYQGYPYMLLNFFKLQ